MSRLRILLADDHAILREGLAMLIGGQPDMEVVAQADTGVRAVEAACSVQPDVAVLDISMPDMNGAEAAERIRAQCPQVRVLALSRHADQAYLRRLMQAGATGYVVKRSAADTLIHAIRAVARGETYIEPQLAEVFMRRALHGSARPEGTLSSREEEVLRFIAWGRSNKEIAAELGLSVKTVESYRASAVGKLALHSRADIVRYAATQGWLAEGSGPE